MKIIEDLLGINEIVRNASSQREQIWNEQSYQNTYKSSMLNGLVLDNSKETDRDSQLNRDLEDTTRIVEKSPDRRVTRF
jgi:hypothetical protein